MSEKVLDLKGLRCPLPVLKTRKAMRDLPAGARLAVETTDPLAAIDMPAFCSEDGHTLIEAREHGDFAVFVIEKHGDRPG